MRSEQARLCRVGAAALLVSLVAGCYVKVDKSKNGEDKDVTIHLPMGGLHVEQNQTTPADMGLASYPGATTRKDDKGGDSANVQMGFGDWQLHVRTAKYQTVDPEPKVDAFYRSALARYGQVIECRGDHAVGSLTETREGLTCEDSGRHGHGIHVDTDREDYNLRAGSRRHQHIVAISGVAGGTHFTLLQLDLPASSEKQGGEE